MVRRISRIPDIALQVDPRNIDVFTSVANDTFNSQRIIHPLLEILTGHKIPAVYRPSHSFTPSQKAHFDDMERGTELLRAEISVSNLMTLCT